MDSSISNSSTGRAGDECGDRFLADGYVIAAAEDLGALETLRANTAAAAAAFLNIPVPSDAGHFLDHIHERVTVDRLNDFRLSVRATLQNDPDFLRTYFACGQRLVQTIVGSELAMQRGVGLSIQLPGDDSSLLPLHSDTWGSECSPFEVVLWIPLVDCRKTKSMFLLPPDADRLWRARLNEFEQSGTEALYRAVEPQLKWLDIRFGQILLFTPTLMHGNRVNRESTTRWSFNVRFKGLFTPYANKTLGEYFVPWAVSPASRIGIGFDIPAGNDA